VKFGYRSVEMNCYLSLSEQETEMLAWLAGYGGKEIAKAIAEKLTTKYSAEQWEKFWTDMRGELGRQSKLFRDARQVFEGRKIAADIPVKP
jgi:hypothetical protein